MVINEGGNVGIGTANTSSYKVDIFSDNYNTLRLRGNYPLLKLSSPLFNSGNGAEIWQNANGTAFYNVNSILNAFVTSNQGFVGIGTTNPDQKLSVAGTIHAQAIKVDMNGWSDYVFNPTYVLSSLEKVKIYLDKNHHLPDMPSEKEIVKNGVELGEMIKLQQKKIEELTLYIIGQEKRIILLEHKLKKP